MEIEISAKRRSGRVWDYGHGVPRLPDLAAELPDLKRSFYDHRFTNRTSVYTILVFFTEPRIAAGLDTLICI